MAEHRHITWILAMCLIFVSIMAYHKNASAVPSFARQTGFDCHACHTAFPELTPLGRSFKLGGYLMSKKEKPFEFPPPLAGMAQLSYTHSNRSQPKDAFDDNWATRVTSRGNNIVSIPQQMSGFYGGRIVYNLGVFAQGTYDGNADASFLDNTDIRFAGNGTLFGEKILYGITVNNNPTVQDVWNSTPAWGFPYAASGVAPAPATATMIDGTLGSQVGGIGIYGYWNDMVYAEAALYRTARTGLTKWMGAGTPTDTVVDDVAPYWRLVLQHAWEKSHSLSVGTYGMVAKVFPSGGNKGPYDTFTDVAFDAQYQYIVKQHVVSAQTTWIHEKQDLDASFAQGISANSCDKLNTFRVNLNYYYRSHLGDMGGTVAYFSTTGDKDTLLYSPDPIGGSKTGKPNSDGFVLEADYFPWKTGKISLQYTMYDRFNGASHNYDGSGRNASDNNTIFMVVWIML
jgi:hypothetical protein